ncbi:MAG: TetR/AcrR family transcriptional regulator [Hyphomicrobiaceae bacterium]
MANQSGTPPSPAGKRREASEQRRQAILEAAIEVFAAEGFAAARLDAVAAKAGVAKGTIYLFFKDKEDLFEQILTNALVPMLGKAQTIAGDASAPLDVLLERLLEFLRAEILGTRRRDILRLIITEGHRFPRIAQAYHREIVSKGMAIMQGLAQRAHARGELATDDLARFPQLVFAPVVMAVVWDGLFSKFQPLDVKGLLEAHRRLIVSASTDRERREP